MLTMGSRRKCLLVFLALLIVSISLIFLLEFSIAEAQTNPSFSQPTSLAKPTPYQLLPTPSTIAPSKNYTVPPLSSLNLKRSLTYGGASSIFSSCSGLIYIKGGSGNDINFRVIDPQGKIILDLGRISNEKSFYFYANKTGNFTFIFDNEFSVFSSKEVDVFQILIPIISLSLLDFQSTFG